MYQPAHYLTMQVAAEVLAEFEWPAPYTLEDWLPDGIAMVFPRCTLMFSEGFESNMVLSFLPDDTGLAETVTLTHALVALKAVGDPASLPPEPRLRNDRSAFASLDKVKNGLRDLSTLVLAYLRPCLLGDFRWVDAYRAYRARPQ